MSDPSRHVPLTPVESSVPPRLGDLSRLELLSARHNDATSELYLRYRIVGRGPAEA